MWPIFVCATVDLEKILHGTPLTEINNVVDDGPLLISPSMVDASAAMH